MHSVSVRGIQREGNILIHAAALRPVLIVLPIMGALQTKSALQSSAPTAGDDRPSG